MRNLREVTAEIRKLAEELRQTACENDKDSPSDAQNIRERAEELSRTAFRLDFTTILHPDEFEPDRSWSIYDSAHD